VIKDKTGFIGFDLTGFTRLTGFLTDLLGRRIIL
jgi:hypothetical protein